MESGEAGDARGSSVELHEARDLSGAPVVVVTSDSTEQPRASSFEVSGLTEGSYYILAWKDSDGNGVVSNQDLVGVRGEVYRPGHGGSEIEVLAGATIDAGDVLMRAYRAPLQAVSGARNAALDSTSFTYSFNYDVVVTSLSVSFPGSGPVADPEAAGPKTAKLDYVSSGWSRAGRTMPNGIHSVHVHGTLDGELFRIVAPVEVQ
jgi:hypothetical protein